MFLISLAKSLPRLASMAAFLCFVVAHLLWPLMRLPLTISTNNWWNRWSPVTSGWKEVAISDP